MKEIHNDDNVTYTCFNCGKIISHKNVMDFPFCSHDCETELLRYFDSRRKEEIKNEEFLIEHPQFDDSIPEEAIMNVIDIECKLMSALTKKRYKDNHCQICGNVNAKFFYELDAYFCRECGQQAEAMFGVAPCNNCQRYFEIRMEEMFSATFRLCKDCKDAGFLRRLLLLRYRFRILNLIGFIRYKMNPLCRA